MEPDSMKQTVRKISVTLVMISLLSAIQPASALAATINLSPSTGTYPPNRPFTVDLVVDEQTDAFNAAQAEVTLSSNLTASDLVIGDCEFSFVKTPTIQSPSFVGVTLGGSKKHCTVYSLTVIPSGTTEGTITLSDASVKRYGDAQELISAVAYGKYAVGSASIGTMLASAFPGTSSSNNSLVPVTNAASTIKTESDRSSYTVAVKVMDASHNPIKNAEVALSAEQQASNTQVQTTKTDNHGVATFSNVSPNVYTVKATEKDNLIAQATINAKGSDEVLTLGVEDQRPAIPVIILIAGVIVVSLVILFFFRANIKNMLTRKNNVQIPTQ